MFSSSPNAAKSADNLTALSPIGHGELPFHSSNHRHPQMHPHPSARRGSTASSIHSVGGVLDSAPSSLAASVYESSQNAISTLLQPPIVRTGLQPHTSAPASTAHKPPTARDIPPVTLTNITRVNIQEFSPYLSKVGALYDQLQRLKESDEEANKEQRSDQQDTPTESSGDGYLRPGPKPRPTRKGSTASLSSMNSNDGQSPVRRPSAGFIRRSTQGPPPLSTIPTVYFDDEFHLENPRTFDIVSERSEVIRPANAEDGKGALNGSAAAPRKALATNAILQEKLSWYMDTIEVHLINSISTASTTFFTALGSLKELHSEAAESVERIKTLRKELEALDEEIATKGLQIVHQRRRQENLRQLNDAVLQLKQIADGVAGCESLVNEGEIDKALASIDSLEKLIAGERDPTSDDQPKIQLLDLRSASALQGVNDDLALLRSRIGKAYETNFQDILIRDLRRHVESVSSQEILLRWDASANRSKAGHIRSPSVFPTYLTNTDELKAELLPNMVGLHRAKHIAAATVAYREAVLREIRNLIRRPLPSSTDDDNESMMSVSTASGGRHLSNQEKSSILARNLRALDPEDGEDLLVKIYIGVTETLRRLTTQVKVLLEITSSLTESAQGDTLKSPTVRSPISSPRPDRFSSNPMNNAVFEVQEELHKSLDITNLLGQAVDVAIEKIVKVLKVRAEQTAQLPLTLFLRYFTLNLYFANECESISGRSGTSLKNVVNGHIKDFVQRNRDAEMQKLAQGMESDQWNAKDFDEKNTELLNTILGSSTHDPQEWTDSTKIWIPNSELEHHNEETIETNGTGKEKTRTATIDSESFMLPKSAILCLEGIAKFSHLTNGIPSMTLDIATSLIAYLQLFNSRCTQLILGAGATRSAGLKNITTKHLALASQALSFTATLIPHVREFVRRHAGSGANVSNVMGEFDKIRRLLQEHQDSIYQKLVEIMSGRAAIHSRTMKTIDWEADGGKGVHAYMETLAKETTTLHRVLTKHLPETSIQMIMLPVFSSYRDQLGSSLRDADPKTEASLKSMNNDIEFLTTKLGKLDGFGDTGEYLQKIVKSKQVKTVEPATEPTPEKKDDEPKENETAPSAEAAESTEPAEKKE
ncbi:Vps54-like protein-domain-containing protein [Fusarium flagelliforme]|uniref:Vps54-like protein-domain-containing protein n=1 Tax=Fusarium flagelliforme TaxID=2675880 RepID=UPI001E8E3249|nr:Vps54-like protein-domain-containing protein [Fusarium flagelliforme]KAH7188989.1 Vps54-like protein-domain-containing protein [Fusarium flagelliforme]